MFTETLVFQGMGRKSRFCFARKNRIVRSGPCVVRFPCHDNQCHTRNGKPSGNAPSSTQTGRFAKRKRVGGEGKRRKQRTLE